jgi:hypothetical protein
LNHAAWRKLWFEECPEYLNLVSWMASRHVDALDLCPLLWSTENFRQSTSALLSLDVMARRVLLKCPGKGTKVVPHTTPFALVFAEVEKYPRLPFHFEINV